MPEETNKNSSKDNLALIVGGIFILGLVFAAYTYFNKGDSIEDKIKRNADRIDDIISSNTERDGEDAGDKDGSEAEEMEDRNEVLGTGGPVSETLYWTANDYEEGDISGNSYTVKSGDTLWEIAEAVYGDGSEWVKILNANSSDIGFLSNGSQALITAGQVIVLP